MKTTCAVQKRERKEKVPVPPAQTFSRSKNISFLPGGGTSSHHQIRLRFSCLPQHRGETLALFRFDQQQQQQHSASQIQTGNGAPHATRVAWLYYARPAPRAGRSYGRPCVDRKAKRLADSTSATAKKGAVPVRRLLPQPPIGMKKKRQAPRRRKEASATFQSEVKRSQSHTEVMYATLSRSRIDQDSDQLYVQRLGLYYTCWWLKLLKSGWAYTRSGVSPIDRVAPCSARPPQLQTASSQRSAES